MTDLPAVRAARVLRAASDEPTPADIERGQFIARGLNELADIVNGPLWVRRYDEARRAEYLGGLDARDAHQVAVNVATVAAECDR